MNIEDEENTFIYVTEEEIDAIFDEIERINE